MSRRGYATATVLWLITAAGVFAAATALAAGESVQVARFRGARARAHWLAEGCIARARAVLDSLAAARHPWERLASTAELQRRGTGCRVSLEPAGGVLDVNDASEERLTRLLMIAGVHHSAAETFAAALSDWRDADDNARTAGAEREWYSSRARVGPRNGPLAAVGELAYVRGFSALAEAARLLGVEPGRTPINLAPLPVVGSLPGFTPEAMAELSRARARGEWLASLAQLIPQLSGPAGESLAARLRELSGQVTTAPDAWILAAEATEPATRITATVELRLVDALGRAAITRRRAW
jgi:type II secretory pathway component PulK